MGAFADPVQGRCPGAEGRCDELSSGEVQHEHFKRQSLVGITLELVKGTAEGFDDTYDRLQVKPARVVAEGGLAIHIGEGGMGVGGKQEKVAPPADPEIEGFLGSHGIACKLFGVGEPIYRRCREEPVQLIQTVVPPGHGVVVPKHAGSPLYAPPREMGQQLSPVRRGLPTLLEG